MLRRKRLRTITSAPTVFGRGERVEVSGEQIREESPASSPAESLFSTVPTVQLRLAEMTGNGIHDPRVDAQVKLTTMLTVCLGSEPGTVDAHVYGSILDYLGAWRAADKEAVSFEEALAFAQVVIGGLDPELKILKNVMINVGFANPKQATAAIISEFPELGAKSEGLPVETVEWLQYMHEQPALGTGLPGTMDTPC